MVRRTIYTTQPTEFETIAAIEKVQGSSDHPPQTIRRRVGLALPGLLIEIEATVSLASPPPELPTDPSFPTLRGLVGR